MKTLKPVLVGANLAIAVIIIGAVSSLSIQDHGRVEEKAFQSSENLVSVLAGHTRQTVAAIDRAMDSIATAVVSGANDSETLTDLLMERQSLALGNYGYFVLDAEGSVLATTMPEVRATPNLHELEEYRNHRDNPTAGLVLSSRPVSVGGHEGTWIVSASRRIDDSRGAFAGVMVTVLPMADFLALYEVPWLGEAGSVSLFNGERMMVARQPFADDLVGRHYVDQPWMRRYVTAAQRGRILSPTHEDGLRRYSTFEHVGHGDAVLLVGLDERRTFAAWRLRLVFAIAMSSAMIALLAGASFGLYGYFRRRNQWAEEHSRRLRLIARESEALLYCHDEGSVLQRVTEGARELIGARQAATSVRVEPQDAYTVLSPPDSVEVAGYAGLQRLVCKDNRPLRLNRVELETHPLWRAENDSAEPPSGGWLGVPLIAGDGTNLGLVQTVGKLQGEFSADDESELVQLASIASAILDSLRAMRARQEALAAANTAHQQVESIFASISDGVYAVDREWCIVYLNPRAEEMLDRSHEELVGKVLWDMFAGTRGSLLEGEFQRAVDHNVTVDFEFFYAQMNSWFAIRAYPSVSGLTVYFQDISDRVETAERLRQAQKLDAIGQLTGGIAHDFNNLLTVIMGSSEALLATLADNADSRHHAQVILQASERGASLTHRLLAFARRQPLQPQLVNINQLVADSEQMMRRLLAEDIHIELVRGSGLWQAVADPSELQSAILNLAINARDAMPDGGKLTIETANIAVDAEYGALHAIDPGQYVMVAVSDTGEGIVPEALDKVFEPFFTTKEVGKGSGLGLSMVYGFARQSGGHARIYSEAGEGTTVRLYLPRENGDTEVVPPVAHRTRERYQGTESVLVVEDDDLVRQHTLNNLTLLGYQATACADGPAALALLDAGQRFDLLLTDVVLPGGMSGRQVAEAVTGRVREMKVLYMSGYTENAIVHHGRLDRGVHLLAKPFRLADLGRKVREVLDGGL